MNEISNGNICIQASEQGAELQSITSNDGEYLYQKKDGFWQRQSPILFPIVGRLKNDTYEHKGKEYSIPQHGFLRDKKWECLGGNRSDELVFRVSSDHETHEKFPWDFEVQIRYRIDNATLHVQYSVTNTGNEILPFSLGAHPAFRIEGSLNDYSIVFENDEGTIEYNLLDQEQKGLLSGSSGVLSLNYTILELSESLFQLDALIFRNLSSRRFTLLRKGETVFTFDRGNFPHFALWKQPDAPFLCFEPWQGYADTVDSSGKISEKPGIVELNPGETRMYEWSIDIGTQLFT